MDEYKKTPAKEAATILIRHMCKMDPYYKIVEIIQAAIAQDREERDQCAKCGNLIPMFCEPCANQMVEQDREEREEFKCQCCLKEPAILCEDCVILRVREVDPLAAKLERLLDKDKRIVLIKFGDGEIRLYANTHIGGGHDLAAAVDAAMEEVEESDG